MGGSQSMNSFLMPFSSSSTTTSSSASFSAVTVNPRSSR